MAIGLQIMGMGMFGIFTAMVLIMLVTYLLQKLDKKK